LKILDDYIAQIYGHVYDSETLSEKSVSQKAGGVNVDVPVFSVHGKAGKDYTIEGVKEVSVTPAAKFDKLFAYLSKDEDVKYYEFVDDAIYHSIVRGECIEILACPRFSKLKSARDTAKALTEFASIYTGITGEKTINEKNEKMIESFSSLRPTENIIPCVFEFADSKFPIVAYMDEQYFQVGLNLFNSDCTLLCKIQRKIQKGEKIELDAIFDAVKNVQMNREQRRNLSNKKFSNPDLIRDIIRGPALVVIPIAAYQ